MKGKSKKLMIDPTNNSLEEYIERRKLMNKKNKTLSLVNGSIEKIQAEILKSQNKLIAQSDIVDYALYDLFNKLKEDPSYFLFVDYINETNNSSVSYEQGEEDGND